MPALGSPRMPDPLAGLAALKPYGDAAEFVRLDLFTPVGRTADGVRAERQADEPPARGVRFAAFGLTGFDWPRAEVVSRTATRVAQAVLKGWVGPNPKRTREVVPGWSAERWAQLGLTPDAILGHLQSATELDAKAVAGYECLVQYAHYQKGMRKPSAAEFADAARQFPRSRFEALLTRQLTEIYKAVREALAGQLADVSGCRTRIESAARTAEPAEGYELPPGPRRRMPPGCPAVADAVTGLPGVLSEPDLAEV